MTGLKTLVVAGLGLLLGCAVPPAPVEGEAAGPEAASPPKADAAADKPGMDSAVATIKMAHDLAHWGRHNENPAALALASKILQSVRTVPIKKEAILSKTPKPAEKKRPEVTPQTLLDEAKALCGDNQEHLRAVAAIREMKIRTRRTLGGAARHVDTVMRYDTDVYRIVFRRGETAEMAVLGDGDTGLDLYVYDDRGNLVVSDTGGVGRCHVKWVPHSTAPFVVKIKNRGGVANQYTLVTN